MSRPLEAAASGSYLVRRLRATLPSPSSRPGDGTTRDVAELDRETVVAARRRDHALRCRA